MRTDLCTAALQFFPPPLIAIPYIQQLFLPLTVDSQKPEIKDQRSEVKQEKTTHSIGNSVSDHEKRLQLNK